MTRAVDTSINKRACAACAGNPLLLGQVAAAMDAGEEGGCTGEVRGAVDAG
ncbi:MAG: hypothetical protein M3256_12685 [Actinomycetota bacterium]|nr:hypothetical protein [Actinomycetota bacterium]